MNLKQLIDCVRFKAKHISRCGSIATWYLFGSVARSWSAAKDIDLLVVCDSHNTANMIRETLRGPCLFIPLHILLLTSNEEIELGFVNSEDCVQIFPNSEWIAKKTY